LGRWRGGWSRGDNRRQGRCAAGEIRRRGGEATGSGVRREEMSSIWRRRRPGETQRGAHGVDLAAVSIQGEEKAWGSCEASKVSPMPRRRCRRSGRGVEERRGDERERARQRRSPGVSGGTTLASAGGAGSSLSDAASRGGGMRNRRMWATAAAPRIGERRRRFRFWVVERMRWRGGWGHSGKTWPSCARCDWKDACGGGLTRGIQEKSRRKTSLSFILYIYRVFIFYTLGME
jgi:hypothetical protein